jgi:hypothetical protein
VSLSGGRVHGCLAGECRLLIVLKPPDLARNRGGLLALQAESCPSQGNIVAVTPRSSRGSNVCLGTNFLASALPRSGVLKAF